MKFFLRVFGVALACMVVARAGNSAKQTDPLRVAIAGLVHGHVDGFFEHSAHRPDIKIVGISDPDRGLFDRYSKKYNLDAGLYHADLEEMLRSVKPQAVLIYSSTFDHAKIVETCAKQHVSVMMEKPLA